MKACGSGKRDEHVLESWEQLRAAKRWRQGCNEYEDEKGPRQSNRPCVENQSSWLRVRLKQRVAPEA